MSNKKALNNHTKCQLKQLASTGGGITLQEKFSPRKINRLSLIRRLGNIEVTNCDLKKEIRDCKQGLLSFSKDSDKQQPETVSLLGLLKEVGESFNTNNCAKYLKVENGMCQIMEELIYEEKEEAAVKMIEGKKLSFEDIANYLGLTMEQVEEIAKKNEALQPSL